MEKKEYDKVLLSKVRPKLRKLYETSKPIIHFFNKNSSFPDMIMVSVLLQNAYSSDSIDEIKKISSLIKKVSDYNKTHIINWISNEMDFIITGEDMALEMMLTQE